VRRRLLDEVARTVSPSAGAPADGWGRTVRRVTAPGRPPTGGGGVPGADRPVDDPSHLFCDLGYITVTGYVRLLLDPRHKCPYGYPPCEPTTSRRTCAHRCWSRVRPSRERPQQGPSPPDRPFPPAPRTRAGSPPPATAPASSAPVSWAASTPGPCARGAGAS